MPIQELINFRTKYPQYGDLSDSDLADKLASKFPDAYSDLPSLVVAEAPEEKASFRSEIMGPITHAASALAFDVPRTAMEMQVARGEPGAEQAKKFLYPEQKTLPGKIFRAVGEGGATLVGGASRLAGTAFKKVGEKLGIEAAKGAMKKAPTFLGKASLLGKQVVQGAAGGATFGAATTAPTPEEYLKNIEANTKFGAIIPAGLTGAGSIARAAGKGLTKTGHFISEQFGGVTKATRDTISRLGAERVFEPIKSTANYVGQVLVPRAQAKLSNSINKFTKNVEDVAVNQFKVPLSVVSDIKSFGTKTIRQTSEANANSTQGIVTKIQQAMDVKEEAAHKAYREAIGSFKGKDIVVDPFYRNIQSSLRNKGWIDLRGNPTSRYKSGLNTTYDKLTDLYRDMKTQTSKGKEISGRLLSKEDFSTYRDVLMDMIKERPSDLVIHKARYALYDAAEASGMKGLKAARDAERTVFEANRRFQTTNGELKSILQEPTLERFYKLPQQKIKALKDLEKYTGTKIIDDIRQINAAKYLRDLEKKLLDPSGLEKDLHATGNPKASILKDAYGKLLGKNIMGDLDAHFANRDFRLVTDVPGTGGTIYPSRAGFIRSGISGAARKYYKDIKPAFIRGKEKLEGVGKKVGQYYQSPLDLSPGTKDYLKNVQSGLSIKDVSNKPGFAKTSRESYVYHYTSDKNLSSIAKQGLLPKGEGGANYAKRVYYKPHTIQTEPGESLLRIKERKLNDLELSYPDEETTLHSYSKVSPKDIEIKQGSKWISLLEKLKDKKGFANFSGDVYQGEKDITTKILKKLEGRSTVSKQFISDLTNQPELKQVERDLIRQVLNESGDTVLVKEFANKVKMQLLPLKRSSSMTTKQLGGIDPSELSRGELRELEKGIGGWTPMHEGTTLPDSLRGPIQNYFERIYESPIKTSAGKAHFEHLGESIAPGYFAHTRAEDLPRGKEGTTRRIIELQSDLFQKGNLQDEYLNPKFATRYNSKFGTPEEQELFNKSLERLKPYENTWHERIIREEIKQAAKDGKTKLQFPTGETAMKIEGLGISEDRWFISRPGARGIDLKPDMLKVGLEIRGGEREVARIQRPGEGWVADSWIITDVLGEGKFKAIPKGSFIKFMEDQNLSYKEALEGAADSIGETFDISGKIDTNNPIYRFYEKEVARYLKRVAPDTKLITDKQGVTWYQMEVPKAAKDRPIEAFAAAGAPVLLAPRKKESSFSDEGAILSIIGEAEDQGPEGMRAVASGIRNRGTLKGVYGRNSKRVKGGQYSKEVYQQAKQAWLDSAKKDYVNGADHWENTKQFGKPKWANEMEEVTRVGDHSFYRKRSKPSLIKSKQK